VSEAAAITLPAAAAPSTWRRENSDMMASCSQLGRRRGADRDHG
jgi:hypothetical protein